MVFVNMDRVAMRIGNTRFADLDTNTKERLLWTAQAVEQQLSLPPFGFRLSGATVTEFLPRSIQQIDDFDLSDYETQQNGTIIPLDVQRGTTILQLSHTPVLLSGLQIWEQYDGNAGQGTNKFPSSTLLTEGVDYFLDCDTPGLSLSGKVHRIGATWSNQPRSVKATYKGGPAAQIAANLGPDFADIFEETVAACTVHNYSFWKQQQESFESGNNGQNVTSESLGKFSQSLGPMRGTAAGGQFDFGSMAELCPGELTAPLAAFINVGALLVR